MRCIIRKKGWLKDSTIYPFFKSINADRLPPKVEKWDCELDILVLFRDGIAHRLGDRAEARR
ncbi:MAG: hypothetical protein CME25_23060 [Gemmatimonadetes bacterium]|nr:hypothetical protein [Gemmatimonadota bacterium]